MRRLVTLSHEPSVAVEHGDIERDVVVAQRTARRLPRGLRNDLARGKSGPVSLLQYLQRGVGRTRARDQLIRRARVVQRVREPAEIDFAGARMQVEQALAELG